MTVAPEPEFGPPSAPEESGRPSVVGAVADIRAEAERLSAAAVGGELPARIMGGLAVWLLSSSARIVPYARHYRDIDLVAPGRDRKAVSTFLEASGYVGDRLFNALHGAQRMVFSEPGGRWSIDVIFDELRMSHRIDLRGRLAGPRGTLDLADLLLTKLQVWEINEKDLGDLLCLLADHPLAAPRPNGGGVVDPDGVDVARLCLITGADWGLCHTVERNLPRVADLWARQPAPGARYDAAEQVAQLLAQIDAAPKSLGWRTRARIGERVRWYETPEEIRR